MNGGDLYALLTSIWALLALPAFALALTSWDPVGRAGGPGVGPRMGGRAAWVVMEAPALVVFPAIYLWSGNLHPVGNVVLVIWLAHYAHRTLLWPFLVPRRHSESPVVLCASGFAFNCVNGVLWGWFLGHLADYPTDWMGDPRFLLGLCLALGGAALNVWSDYRLRGLRSRQSDAYVVPKGGPFEMVSSPHLLGEIIEWIGLAILAWALPGLAFALWTLANLLPRALWRHRWYQERFPTYPENRRALVPYLL